MNPGATQHRDLVHIARLNKLGFDDQQQDDTLNSKGQRQAHKKALFLHLDLLTTGMILKGATHSGEELSLLVNTLMSLYESVSLSRF